MSTTNQSGTSDSVESPATPSLTQEEAFTVLSNRRRRHTLHYLFQREDPVSLHDLSTQLAAWENDISASEVTYKQRMRLYTALRQVHLPQMDDSNVIDFDADTGVAELTDTSEKLEVYLDIVPHNEIPWSSYYLGLGVVSAGLLTIAAVGVFPFGVVPDFGWGFIVTGLVLISGLSHKRHDQRNRLGRDKEPPL